MFKKNAPNKPTLSILLKKHSHQKEIEINNRDMKFNIIRKSHRKITFAMKMSLTYIFIIATLK